MSRFSVGAEADGIRVGWVDLVEPGVMTAREPEADAPADAPPGPVRIQVMRDGVWQHPRYGEIRVDASVRERMVRNFAADVRRMGAVPLDYDHEPGPAPGWITGLRAEGDSLVAEVELTPRGRQQVRDGEYRFFSPEWSEDWQDPATGARHGPTLLAGALTNRPFFRGMQPVMCCAEGGESPRVGAGAPEESMTHTDGGATATAAPADVAAVVPAEIPAARTGSGEEPGQQAAEIQRLREEVVVLRARETQRLVTEAVTGLRFGERATLAPAAREALIGALVGLPEAARTAVLGALGSIQFAELGERGFAAPANAGTGLTPEQETAVLEMARTSRLPVETLRATYTEIAARRAGGTN